MDNQLSTPSFDPLHLRKVAASFATGITLVTTFGMDGKIHGMTINSFVSVSLNPALVMVSVKNTTQFMEFMRKGQSIGISILNDHQQMISDYFGGLSNEKPDVRFQHVSNCPILDENIGWYAARVSNLVPTGDHMLIICQVFDCGYEAGMPLLYFDGYKQIGPPIKS